MYAYAHVHLHARIHASQHGSQISKSHQFDPQLWGGPYPSLKMVSVWSSLCWFSVRNRTGGKPRFDPQMWGGPYPRPKMVSLWFCLCSFSVRNRSGGKLKKSAEVRITSQGTRNGRSICLCAQASFVHVHLCAHLCVYLGVCVDVCKLARACACEHVCSKGCPISSVSLMSITAGHTSEVLMVTRSTQQNQSISNNNTATTTSRVCLMKRGVRVGAASITDKSKKHLR